MPPQTTRWLPFAFLTFLSLAFAFSGRAQKSGPTDVLTISIPDDPAVLELEAPGFLITRNETKDDGSQDFSAENKQTQMTLAVLLWRSAAPATREGCRESLEQHAKKQSKPGLTITDVQFSQLEGMSSLEYFVSTDHGAPLDEKSIVVCLARGNHYAVVHLAKAAFQPVERKQLTDILKTVRFSGPAGTAEAIPSSPPPVSPVAQTATSAADSPVAQGQLLFKTYKCHECHGSHGEGTDDAPDLIGTRLNADEIARFLQKPSAHARSVGMPTLPAGSPDIQPLVAFVLSLKRPTPPR